LKLVKQLSSDAFTLFIGIEGLAVVLKRLGNLLSLDFLFNLCLVSLVLLNCFFCSHLLYFHLLFGRKYTKLDRTTFATKQVWRNVGE
jgi:hypothetical protein